MTKLFKLFTVLDAIVSANTFGHDDTRETLQSVDAIQAHAEALGLSVTHEEAERIGRAGIEWILSVDHNDGGWGRFRFAALQQLED